MTSAYTTAELKSLIAEARDMLCHEALQYRSGERTHYRVDGLWITRQEWRTYTRDTLGYYRTLLRSVEERA